MGQGSCGCPGRPTSDQPATDLRGSDREPSITPLPQATSVRAEFDSGPSRVLLSAGDAAREPPSLLRRWFEAGDSGNLDAFDELLHEGIVVHAPLGFATRGLEAEKASWRRALDGVPDLLHDVQETVSEGSTEAARVIVTGTHAGEFDGTARYR